MHASEIRKKTKAELPAGRPDHLDRMPRNQRHPAGLAGEGGSKFTRVLSSSSSDRRRAMASNSAGASLTGDAGNEDAIEETERCLLCQPLQLNRCRCLIVRGEQESGKLLSRPEPQVHSSYDDDVPIQSGIYIKSSISSPQHRTHKARTSKHPHASSTTAPGAVKPSQTITERQAAKLVEDVASGRAILSEKVRRSAPQ